MRFNTLPEWLRWQESLHPREIELGLERVGEVLLRLELTRPNFKLITVAGTNGKGSSVAMLEAILLAAGYHVGSYTSPHLLRYNERIKVDGRPVDDATLCAAFSRIDAARLGKVSGAGASDAATVSLSYFEFGTLAAIDILQRAGVDIAILEVGLGGRLDAVNVLDADVALITAIDVDHVDWLGADRETIAREKAGILRSGRPAVCADPSPPSSLLAYAAQLATPLSLLARDFFITRPEGQEGCWDWQGAGQAWRQLPIPALPGAFQLRNAAGVLAALAALAADFPLDQAAICQGLKTVRLPGRFQVLEGLPMQILDVAHNAQSAQALAENLRCLPRAGRTRVVLAMLTDKDIASVVGHLTALVDVWYLAPLDVPRAAPLSQLQAAFGDETTEVFASVTAAHRAALAASEPQDLVVVCGSFHTVAAVLGDTV
ncbi:MAG: bifunctional tetrahydrofolate synthase/dihydrofolate synthase [Gammaproteobacteria bacterium]|nr:bifunctional tetrahydrofolate synthase/dihydrofolate synthase [Gammaproteobacteria bacterium]